MRHRRVIVVERDPGLRGLATKILGGLQGASVLSFEGADEAIEALQGEMPAVLISDLGLPGITGIELIVRARRQWPRMPVIVTTSKRSRLQIELARFSFADIWEKPFPLQDLRERVRSILASGAATAYPPFDVIDYLQMASFGYQDLILEFGFADGRNASVEVVDGEVCSCRLGELRGDAAMQTVLAARPQKVDCRPRSARHGVRAVDETVHLFEEVAAATGPPPS
jgi:DNA-binding response OmpR family regulator